MKQSEKQKQSSKIPTDHKINVDVPGGVIDTMEQKAKSISAEPEEKQLQLIDHNNEPVTEQSLTSNMVKIDFETGEMPDLDELDIVPLDLASGYWTPKAIGESKRAYFLEIRDIEMQSLSDKTVTVDLPCAFFMGKENGTAKGFCNASKVLVSVLEQTHIEKGMAIIITYMGKKKNSSNNFHSDVWSVKPLMHKIIAK